MSAPVNAKALREKLVKIMPGYDWTVHRQRHGETCLIATGIQTSGFNRLSTLEVTYSSDSKGDWYKARSAGFGKRAPWLHENGDVTLARALRGLQDYYGMMANTYGGHDRALQNARAAKATGAA